MSEPSAHGMAEEARAWAEENGEVSPTPEPAASSSSAAAASSAPAAPATEAEDDAEESKPSQGATELAAQLAAFGWGVLDVFVPKWFGQRMKLEPAEMSKLVEVTTPVIAKRLPTDVSGEISDEELLLSTAAFVYAPKFLSPEPKRDERVPPAGGDAKDSNGSSGGPSVKTEAHVDGRPVQAQVLQ